MTWRRRPASTPRSISVLALNAWAGREGCLAVGDEVRMLDQQMELAIPDPGRFA